MDSNDNVYFAAKPAEELISTLYTRINETRQGTTRNGIQKKWRRSYQLFFGKHFGQAGAFALSDSEIVRTGDKGEYAAFSINHYRNLIKHTLALACNEKPAFDVLATNSDPESLDQCKLGDSLIEHYLMDKRVGRYFKSAAEQALVLGKGYVFMLWDPGLGKAYGKTTAKDENGEDLIDPETGEAQEKIVYEGDLSVHTPSVYDVYTDPSADDWNHLSWCDVGLLKNKFDLIAQYPAKKDEILAVSSNEYMNQLREYSWSQIDEAQTVQVRYFTHKKSKALPAGRLTIYVGDDCILYDGPTPYEDKLPLFRIVPGEVFGSTHGYTDFFDIMGMQEALDVLVSIGFTNLQANATQKVWAPEGCNLSVTQISKGLAFLRSAPGTMPVPLQLAENPKDLLPFASMIQKSMELTSGINAVARGDADSVGKNASGISIAYVQAMAAQYTSAFQQSWGELLEDGTSFLLWLLKNFADAPRLIRISGKAQASAVTEFTKKDLSNIERVKVDIGNPMTKTLGGKLQIADNLLEKNLIKVPQEYLTLVKTGNLDPVVEGPEADLDLVHKENEALTEGRPVKSMVGDPHLLHMQLHRKVYADPDLRQKAAAGDQRAQAILSAALNHVMEHKGQYESQPPIFSQIAGEPPAPQPQAPPMGPGGPPPGPPPAPPAPHGPPPPMHPMMHGPSGANGKPGLPQMMQPPQEIAHIPRLPAGLQPNQQGTVK